jgi:hypothetical protein
VRALADGWREAAPGPPGWRVWISATGRWWALRHDPLTAAQIAAGALPLLHADTGTGLAAQIRHQDQLHPRPPVQAALIHASDLPRRQLRASPRSDPAPPPGS